jgi:ubiquinone/menaquinone biosynthesis C-methylase UbiE
MSRDSAPPSSESAEIQSDVQRMFQLSASFAEPRALWATARLGIADLLAQGPRTAQELAQATGVLAQPLARMLRVVASMGVLRMFPPEDPAALELTRFELTRLGQLLRSNVPWSMRSWVLMTGRSIYESFSEILYSLKTGKPAFEQVHEKPMYQYFRDNPEEAEAFNAAMTSYGGQSAAALRDYDFSGVGRICDVGAGAGEVVLSILQAYPGMRGVLFDLPHIVELARERVARAGLSDRCDLVGGDFFQSVPGGDVLVLSSIIHNWPDEQALTILRNCRRAINPGGRLLLAELLIPPGDEPHFAKQTDLVMLVAPGGIERTEGEHRELLAAAKFRLKRVIQTRSLMSVLEAEPID